MLSNSEADLWDIDLLCPENFSRCDMRVCVCVCLCLCVGVCLSSRNFNYFSIMLFKIFLKYFPLMFYA